VAGEGVAIDANQLGDGPTPACPGKVENDANRICDVQTDRLVRQIDTGVQHA
jgi:hypothetical protein